MRKKTSCCITGLLLLSPILTHTAMASMLPSAAMSYQHRFRHNDSHFAAKNGIQAQLSAPLDQQSKYHAFAAVGSNPLQYRLGTRIYGDTKLDSEGFRVMGLYYDRIQLAYGLTKKTGWQASFDITQSGPHNTLSLYAYYPQYLVDTTIPKLVDGEEMKFDTHYTLPGAKLSYTRHISLAKNLQFEPSLQYFYHAQHPQNRDTEGFHGAGITLGVRSSWQKSTLLTSAKVSFDPKHRLHIGLSLQLQGNPAKLKLQDKALRMQRYPSEVWFGSQGFSKLEPIYFDGHALGTYHVISSGKWADLNAVTTNGKPNSFIVVNKNIKYRRGENTGCADILLEDGGAAGKIFTRRVGPTDLSEQYLDCDQRSTLSMQPGQVMVGGHVALTFTNKTQSISFDHLTPGTKPTIRNDYLAGGYTDEPIASYTLEITPRRFYYPSLIHAYKDNHIQGLNLETTGVSRTAVISTMTSEPDATLNIKDVDMTSHPSSTNHLNTGIILYSDRGTANIENVKINTASSYGYGIRLSNDGYADISGNNIITTSGDYGSGILSEENSTANISANNTISTTGDYAHGIELSNSTGNNISGDNTISTAGEFGNGIQLFDSTANISGNNDISLSGNNSRGIFIRNNSTANISGNNTISTQNFGIWIYNNSSATVRDSAMLDLSDVTNFNILLFYEINSLTIEQGAELKLKNDPDYRSCSSDRTISSSGLSARALNQYSNWCND